MSYVSSMIVTCALTEDEDGGLPALHDWCARQRDPVTFQRLDENAAGGNKVMQIDIYACAANYYDHDALAAAFPTFPWLFPKEAVLVAYPEDGPPVIVRGDGHHP